MPGKLARNKKLAANANVEELRRFNAACAKVKMEPSDTLRKLAEAFIERVETAGFVVQPIRLAGPPK